MNEDKIPWVMVLYGLWRFGYWPGWEVAAVVAAIVGGALLSWLLSDRPRDRGYS